MQTKLFIDGEFMAGKGLDQAILDPATGNAVVTVSEAVRE